MNASSCYFVWTIWYEVFSTSASCLLFTENLDEMLEQFKGREEDLVTTLRTMQNYRDESANAGVFEEDSSFGTDD